MRTKVILYGAMAREMGQAEWEFELDSPIEAIRAIEVNTGKMLDYLSRNLETEYRFILDGNDISDINQLQLGEVRELHIMPTLKGASSGSWLAIVGLAILAIAVPIAWGAIAPVAWGGVAGATLTTGQALMLTVGVSLTLAGVAQMLAPTPKVDDVEKPENTPSYIFNGAINTYRQGNPVPLGYGGPMLIGSQVISAGLRSVDISTL